MVPTSLLPQVYFYLKILDSKNGGYVTFDILFEIFFGMMRFVMFLFLYAYLQAVNKYFQFHDLPAEVVIMGNLLT